MIKEHNYFNEKSMKPYTIRIFVQDGDPEGIRIADKMNWTGMGIAFPRNKLQEFKKLEKTSRPGVYVLVGYSEDEENDLPTVYVGEAEDISTRLSNHESNKDFWDRAIVFVSESDALNKAHVKWLEHKLVERAFSIKMCRIENKTVPTAPTLSMHELADIQSFLDEMLSICPLLNLRVFEKSKPVSINKKEKEFPNRPEVGALFINDTVIVPAREDGFKKVFLGEGCWYAIRISGGKLDKIKYIAAYQSSPISAITHYAPVKSIEPFGDTGKYKLNFSESAKAITPIPIGDAPSGAMQGPRYTSLEKLLRAKSVMEAVG